jgi:hypothetical protein
MQQPNTNINKKRNNIIRLIMILSVLLLVGYYCLNKYYLRPRRYKEKMRQEFNNNPNLEKFSESQKINCVDCIYGGLKKKYGDISDFPGESESAVIDLEYYKILISCYAKYMYSGTDRDYATNNLDSLAGVMLINDINKGKIIPLNK